MDIKQINSDIYINKIEEFLLKLRLDVDTLSRKFESDNHSIQNIDNYLLEVNSFYYRTFQENFMPGYKKDIQEEITHLLGMGLQENLLKRHIAGTIKRYTGLFNQIKSISSSLQIFRQNILQRELSFNREIDRQMLEIVYSSKEIQESISRLTEITHQLQSLFADNELFKSVTASETLLMALKSFCSSTSTNSIVNSSYYKLLKNQHHIQNLLKNDRLNTDDTLDSHLELISQIYSLLQFITEDLPARPFSNFYTIHILRTSLHYNELMSLSLQLSDYSRFNELSQEFEDFLEIWINFFSSILPYTSSSYFHLLPELYELNSSNPGYIKELYEDISSTRDSIEKIILEMKAASDMDFTYFSSNIKNILEFAVPLFKTITRESQISPINPLTGQFQQLNLAFSSMDSRIRILDEEHLYTSNILDHTQKLLNKLDSEIEQLNNIQTDLARLLAPRNIARVWKDLDIRITHIPLIEGKPIPSNYLYLVDKYSISTRITDQADNTVLYEEGDIFIIQVEDEIIEEIPYIIIGKKG